MTLVAYVDVPGGPSNNPRYPHALKFAVAEFAQTEIFSEFPSVPGKRAAKETLAFAAALPYVLK